MADTVKIKVGIAVNYVAGSTREDIIEIDRAEWDALTEDEREEQLNALAMTMIENHVEAWANVEED